MRATSTRSERVRAWVLVQVNPEAQVAQVAQGLYGELGHRGGNEFVVVRADIVAEPIGFGDYHIIVPVDAESENKLKEVCDTIRKRNDVSVAVSVRLEQHVPYPPHDAHGYITTEEVEAGRERIEKPGRQGASPGHNPWG